MLNITRPSNPVSTPIQVRHHRKQARKLEATQDDGAIDFEFKMKRAEMQLDLEIREVFLHFMVSVLVRERGPSV